MLEDPASSNIWFLESWSQRLSFKCFLVHSLCVTRDTWKNTFGERLCVTERSVIEIIYQCYRNPERETGGVWRWGLSWTLGHEARAHSGSVLWLCYLGGFKSILVAGSHTRLVRSKSWTVPPSSALLFPFPPIPFPSRVFLKSSSVWLQRTANVENHKVQRKRKEYLSRTLGVQGQRLEVNRSGAAAAASLQLCPILFRQHTRLPRPWDSLGKNTGVGCHFFLQCMKVKSENEDAS